MTCTGVGVRGKIVSFVSYSTTAVQQIFIFAAVKEVLLVTTIKHNFKVLFKKTS